MGRLRDLGRSTILLYLTAVLLPLMGLSPFLFRWLTLPALPEGGVIFDGTAWKNKTGAASASCTVTAKASYNGIRYRCVVTNSYGSVTSSPAKLTVS